jgi:integrase
MDADLVKGNPCARLRRRGVETIGRRVLADDEIRLFWPAIIEKPVSPAVGLALRLILLTGVRPGEAAGAATAEFASLHEKDRARWIIPASRSKNGRAHLVPLTEMARETVLSALELGGKQPAPVVKKRSNGRGKQAAHERSDPVYLFPSPSVDDSPISAHALAVAMARFGRSLDATIGKSWRADPPSPHDLRRTVATRLAELGVSKEDRDAVLNHTPQDVGKKHYDLYEREREKRRALDMWASALTALLDRDQRTNVVRKS